VGKGNAIEVGARRYELTGFHFHLPGEERVDGRSFAMSIHLVHRDPQGRLAVVALVAFAPAAWLAGALASATGQRLLLADARGTVWNGNAVLVLTGGEGSRDASALPGRIEWDIGLHKQGLEIRLSQSCCLQGPLILLIKPGWGRTEVLLTPSTVGIVGQWPSAWLAGLGTPWNTLRLGGTTQLLSSGLTIESAQGRWRLRGGLDIELLHASSRLSTLQTLGSYRLSVREGPPEVQRSGASSGGDPPRRRRCSRQPPSRCGWLLHHSR
jgi:hypothetical protein